jgi:hypothetical protein
LQDAKSTDTTAAKRSDPGAVRGAPRNPQEGRTESRTSRDVRSTSAPPWPNPAPVGPTASGETSSLPQTRPAAPICWIDSPDSRALLPLTGKLRGPGTALDLTVRSRRRGPTLPPPPRASNEGHFSDTDLAAPVPLHTTHRRRSRNDCSRHHGVANAAELPTRRSARVDIGGLPKKSTVSPRDAFPITPPPKDEASTHGGTRAPARWDATGSRKHDCKPGARGPPPLNPATTGDKRPFLVVLFEGIFSLFIIFQETVFYFFPETVVSFFKKPFFFLIFSRNRFFLYFKKLLLISS